MDADGLPLIGSGIDLTKVEAIHQKRTLAFLNHFVTHTARFLNRFSCVCEEKLANLSVRIQRLETTMNLLETKLSSIPGLENVQVTNAAPTQTSNPPSGTSNGIQEQPTPTVTEDKPKSEDITQVEDSKEVPAETDSTPQTNMSQDPTYAGFFKMLKLGIPVMAVKQKMAMQGLDPDVLDNPDAPATSTANVPAPAKAESGDDFSDEEKEESSDDSNAGFSD